MTTSTRAKTNDIVRREWRKLGFFYDCDENTSRWRLVGSRAGLLKFADISYSYATNARREPLSEHEHYGPSFYLTLMTSEEPEITKSAICGTLPEFQRLAAIVHEKLLSSIVGSTFLIDEDYAQGTGSIEFYVREDGFDPADADPL